MNKLMTLAAAAVAATLAASPSFAQDRMYHSDRSMHRGGAYHGHGHNGFWPGAAAGAIVGGALGAAGAIASAPFRDSYASYGYENGYVSDGYASGAYASGGYASGSTNPSRGSGTQTLNSTAGAGGYNTDAGRAAYGSW